MTNKRNKDEWALVLSLLQQPDETVEAPLDRLDSLPFSISPVDVRNAVARKLYKLVLRNAQQERATGLAQAAYETGKTIEQLRLSMQLVDVDAYMDYALAVITGAEGDQISAAAREVAGLAHEDPKGALDTWASQLAAMKLVMQRDVIVTGDQAADNFIQWFEKYQAEMRANTVRLDLMIPQLQEMIPYIFEGHCILITAGTKVGKSSLAQQLLDFNLHRGLNGAIFHFEDSPAVMGIKRTARLLAQQDALGNKHGISVRGMLANALSRDQLDYIAHLNNEAKSWTQNCTEINCAGWTMDQVVATMWRLRDRTDFYVVDYLNKARLTSKKLRNYNGIFGARGQDAEILKTTAEQLGKTVILVQQENDAGMPYETRAAAHKMQVWLSLHRDRDEESGALSNQGIINVRNANVGRTGKIKVDFFPDWLVWGYR